MARGKLLSEVEKTEILIHHGYGRSNRWIARKLNRSYDVINSFFKNPDEYGTKKSPGRPQKLSGREKRRVVTAASNSMLSCAEIRNLLELNVSRETVRRTIHNSGVIKRSKMLTAPALTDIHKMRRLEFARQNLRTDFTLVMSLKFYCLPRYFYTFSI